MSEIILVTNTVVISTVIIVVALTMQSLGFIIGLVKMYRESKDGHLRSQAMLQAVQESVERMQTYRLVERK
jgi:hypothetical protein